MKILVLGCDGYLGWTVGNYLAAAGHEVVGLDNYNKRNWMGMTATAPLTHHPLAHKRRGHANYHCLQADALRLDGGLDGFDAVIHFAEQPSAPFSMHSPEYGWITLENNIGTTWELIHQVRDQNPACRTVKLGTMGEYGTPAVDIPGDGTMTLVHGARDAADTFLFPKRPGSLYHCGKVMESELLSFACRVGWLPGGVTDLHQGVVYGMPDLPDSLMPPLYYDAMHGTAINRFLAQAATGHALTVYGAGLQQRAILHIDDTCQCIELALENPPVEGEYKVMNQYTEVFSVLDMAEHVRHATGAEITHIDNPRVEDAEHYYNPSNEEFLKLGLKPKALAGDELYRLREYIKRYSGNIDEHGFLPTVRWTK
jgi:UDP-sulfoquinovose synthase